MSPTETDSEALVTLDVGDTLTKIASGKVRDLFAIDDDTLLFVASDRISAFDVVMENGIPQKGALLTALSAYWFRFLSTTLPNLRTHFISTSLPSALTNSLPPTLLTTLTPRSMHVHRHPILPLESIVRGYITGSAWTEYKRSGTVHGIRLPSGLVEGAKLPEPLWTPSTKAPAGEKDENISPDRAREILGDAEVARQVEEMSLAIYSAAAAHTLRAGIILADTKFEFGLDSKTREVVLVDEVLTPDSSRFWPADSWEANLGGAQPSFDKQFLRDWLVNEGLKGKEAVRVPKEVVRKTEAKYTEAYERITGEARKG